VYRLLQQEGVSQREIARRTGQLQSEVSEIVRGRLVRDVTVLERICDGLGVPREFMRLSGGAESDAEAYSGGGTVAGLPQEVVEEMRRRVLLATAGIAVAGQPVPGLGELRELPAPAPVPLPARIDGLHVAQVRNLTRRLGEAGNPMITDPTVLSVATAWADRLLSVPGSEPVKRALLVAVAELHIEAGCAGFDAWRYDRAMHHFTTALRLATEAGDTYLAATALKYAGRVIMEFGRPNDGLKMIQCGLEKAREMPDGEQRAVVVGEIGRAAVEATARVDAATALGDLGKLDDAEVAMAKARELWSPTRADRYGDLDRPAALLALRQGQLEIAEALAASSMRRWEGISPLSHTYSTIVLATVRVQAGEPSGLPLAHSAITAVDRLSSVRARRRLQPLATALEARPSRDAHDLARMARQTVSARA
jgi:transcriptional regulator with XRE-family HTH domain/tetratricopeptide (TPR) repeat protein